MIFAEIFALILAITAIVILFLAFKGVASSKKEIETKRRQIDSKL